MATVPGNGQSGNVSSFLPKELQPTPTDLLMSAAITYDRLQRLALDIKGMRPSTNIEDYRPEGKYGKALQEYGREADPSRDRTEETEDLAGEAAAISSGMGKRMKPIGGPL